MTTSPQLRIQVQLDRSDFALKVDLTLPVNGITVLFGPSGSGKTTLAMAVLDVQTPPTAHRDLAQPAEAFASSEAQRSVKPPIS